MYFKQNMYFRTEFVTGRKLNIGYLCEVKHMKEEPNPCKF